MQTLRGTEIIQDSRTPQEVLQSVGARAVGMAVQSRRTTADFDVVIASVSSAVPSHKVSQATVAERAMRVFPHLTGLAGLFATTGIESRYLCETPDWYLEDMGWEELTASFQLMA